jgi:hypothetical protein
MYRVEKVQYHTFIYNSDGANITINHGGKVIRVVKEGRYSEKSKLRPVGSLWMFDGNVGSWFKLPSYMMHVQGEQED